MELLNMIKYIGVYLIPQWVVWVSLIMVGMIVGVSYLIIKNK